MARGFGVGLQTCVLQSLIDQGIDGMLVVRQNDFDRRIEGSVPAPGSSGRDPALQHIGLIRREWPDV